MIGWRTSYRELLNHLKVKLPFAVDLCLQCVAFIMADANPIFQFLVVASQDRARLVFIYLEQEVCQGERSRGHSGIQSTSRVVLVLVHVRGVQRKFQDSVLHTPWHASHANSIVSSNQEQEGPQRPQEAIVALHKCE